MGARGKHLDPVRWTRVARLPLTVGLRVSSSRLRRMLLVLVCIVPLLAGPQLLGSIVGSIITHHRHPKETLSWKETFNSATDHGELDSSVWSYESGGGGWGNGELETYCAPGGHIDGCDPSQPNAFVGRDKLLHIVARRTSDGRFTSARLISRAKKEFRFGRIEVRARLPAGQGIWPAFWMMGADSATVPWPACGEIDVMENLGREPKIVHGTIHGPGFAPSGYGKPFTLPNGAAFADRFHNYGVLWTPGEIAFYVDDPARPYAVYTPKDLAPGATWPFDSRSFYLLLNVAVGGGWPGPPDPGTRFPAEMLVQSIKAWSLDHGPRNER